MKVIFLEDVPKLAKAGEIKEVSDGYGRNYLLPRKLATLAQPGATRMAEQLHQIRLRQKANTDEEMAELAKQLEGKEITIKAKAGAKERLYGAITSADIAAELEKAGGFIVDKRKIELPEPIHQLGSYEVPIKLGKDSPKIKINVVEEETKPGAG